MRTQTSREASSVQDQKPRVLVVDDEPALSDLVSMALRYEGWETQIASNGTDALAAIREFAPDVLVLDIMMPGLDGLEVLQRLRAEGDGVPVLFLTARDSMQDRLTGLDIGGDDYVTKPFSLDELVARVHALARRSSNKVQVVDSSVLRVGDLSLDQDSFEVRRGEEVIGLTSTELEVLRVLMENPSRVVTKAAIYESVWHGEFDGSSTVVELNISYLRKKIEGAKPTMIRTVRGVGYMIRPASDD
ncbi:response regulator transcription factor [Leucobacter coleopterorum]|uniref:Response regulator transcription factor n=1 Tax=Leucobacter coleopterorum TaxID=2714933 RepID=A0ABX6JW50_9MICO|nr:response regulator transcription factor [Leucobacter coleopterorum]QIM18535.1 response regulator transcription factor [Leucobacter coleopterorum]